MKLGILVPEFPTQTHIFFWREMEALRSLGVDVQILSTRRPVDTCPHSFALEAIPKTHYVYPPNPRAVVSSLLRGKGLTAVVRYMASLSERGRRRARLLGYAACAADLADYSRSIGLDHLHVHSCADAAHIAAMAHLLGGPAYSLHLHGDLPVYGTDHKQKMERAAFVAAAARPMQRQVIEQVGIPEERTYTMLMGVDTTRFHARPPAPRKGPLHIVSVSRLALGKGHHFGLAAIRRSLDAGADIRYSIVGSGPDQAAIERDVVTNRLGERVTMVGPLDERAVAELLQTADVFMLPSVGTFEASPVAVMEAMASGVAVICSIIGGTPDMMTHGVDGFLVKQRDVEGLTAAMTQLCQDDELRIRVGAAARARAVERFDSRVLARAMVDAITRARHAAAE